MKHIAYNWDTPQSLNESVLNWNNNLKKKKKHNNCWKYPLKKHTHTQAVA